MHYLLFILVILAVNHEYRAAFSQKLLLSVYYESNCPDSKSFILNQLQPAVQMLQDYLSLRMIPFGKSQSLDYGFGGFECQHGDSACLGNMLQECGLNFMRDRSDVDRVEYVACEMETGAGSGGSLECVEKSNVTAELVKKCIEYGKGTILQLDSEYYTSLVDPKFIPTITIDDTFNQQIQDFAMIDLIGTLCSVLKETPPCAVYYNNMALELVLNEGHLENNNVNPESVR